MIQVPQPLSSLLMMRVSCLLCCLWPPLSTLLPLLLSLASDGREEDGRHDHLSGVGRGASDRDREKRRLWAWQAAAAAAAGANEHSLKE